MQWGYYKATGGSYTLTFPIGFSKAAFSICVTNFKSGAGYAVVQELGKEYAVITNKALENYWIAVGE